MREQDDATGFATLAVPDDTASRHVALATPGFDITHPPVLLLPRRSCLTQALTALGIGVHEFRRVQDAAYREHVDAGAELVATGRIDADALADATAQALGLARTDPAETLTPITGLQKSRRFLTVASPTGEKRVLIVPRLEDLDAIDRFLVRHSAGRDALRITTSATIAEIEAAPTVAERSLGASLGLDHSDPEHSARRTLTAAQGVALGAALVGLALLFVHVPESWLVLRALLLLVFSSSVALRFAAAIDIVCAQILGFTREPITPVAGPHPIYSVLVALRGEKRDSVASLVAALDRLDWPKSKLEILLVCEADDSETVANVRAEICGKSVFRLIETPPSRPRTKPKALNFALPLATGEFVVLYDAEDRPHPQQLEAAWSAFANGGPSLACLQAPLVVTNGARSWLSGQFATEYAVLFHGFLPWLARHGLPMPLGGTSNHFRRQALVEVGAWDSHNVAEDADLGIRLARRGYRIGVIDPPTLEEAPERWIDWRNQRTRWTKGWMQTYLVHMRNPVRLLQDLGARNFIVFQLLFAGMILSNLAQTIVVALLFWTGVSVALSGWPAGLSGTILALDIGTLAIGYAAFATLAVLCRPFDPTGRTGHYVRSLPFYWLLISLASLRALWQLMRCPQLWEKTPHGAAARITGP